MGGWFSIREQRLHDARESYRMLDIYLIFTQYWRTSWLIIAQRRKSNCNCMTLERKLQWIKRSGLFNLVNPGVTFWWWSATQKARLRLCKHCIATQITFFILLLLLFGSASARTVSDAYSSNETVTWGHRSSEVSVRKQGQSKLLVIWWTLKLIETHWNLELQ